MRARPSPRPPFRRASVPGGRTATSSGPPSDAAGREPPPPHGRREAAHPHAERSLTTSALLKPGSRECAHMLRLIGIVISIGLADSLNPSTIAPALYLATGERARERVAEFTLAVFLGVLPRRRGDRVRRPPADQAAVAPPAPPHRGHRGARGRRRDDRRRGASCGATATGCPTAIRPTSIRTAARAGCWGPRSPRSSCPPRSRTSPRSPRSSGPDLGPVRDLVSAARLQLVLRAAAHRDPRRRSPSAATRPTGWLNAGRSFLQRALAGRARRTGPGGGRVRRAARRHRYRRQPLELHPPAAPHPSRLTCARHELVHRPRADPPAPGRDGLGCSGRSSRLC